MIRVVAQFTSDQFFESAEVYCAASDEQGGIYLGTSGNELCLLIWTEKAG